MDRLNKIIEKVKENQRIDIDEGLLLFRQADFLTLASLANRKRFFYHPDKIVTYVVDRNINYTNICVSGCRFCAFFEPPGQGRGYVLSKQVLSDKIQETIDLGGTQILLQGGMNPDLDMAYYVDMLKFIKENFDIHIHGFSPPEISFIAKQTSLSIAQTISILKQAGLSSIPGGGSEILCDDIRQKVSPNKCLSEEWLQVMRQAHLQGMRSSATMMFGHLEEDVHIFEHMNKIRRLQDETHGFTAFIPWTFQPDNTKISVRKKTSVEYLRVLAASRLFLDNIDNIQASWVTQGDKIAQTALFFGANDMGSTMIEENVVASAGIDFMLPKEELTRLISKAGFEPRQRDCYYHLL
ncbi:MAG: dehypoxanthine futalosine cyclase [Proteobacteria bacterium]|nr:dehypoxanthine futalosine cyclase [Pseudomonadota bacterium]MBU1581444.1 dehypoxanthine futalosine cyclase [Pseudomonadota bacterium]MBU2452261.1 dehypoxanthine futalosine cyclase [Pseudomonadota bacterium]MBU2630826.1 dehypoxanthine futalosine cyclase [Pseudomonadota bacterium]